VGDTRQRAIRCENHCSVGQKRIWRGGTWAD
jgi:hypothetical protein